ncbi:type II secretion system protein [Clostridium sp. Sa3CUN1]|uniref:Type II secretion system protein n=1 Tax=Clostridium gallinarum TaxID=2762246 RepID=A0ABR8Q838_9CLOT|nr:type II secretion system protein [Clostridium gallinarum]MBD7916587.1 type II secretion system protein [Clostridium gallinarum]
MCKKKGFALIQTLVVLMIVILLISLSINLISYNYLKSQTFNSYNDKRSLNMEEEKILKSFNKKMPNLNIGTTIEKYKFIQKNNKYYIIKQLDKANRYIEVEIKEYNGNKFLVPTYYKTEDIIGDKYD